MWSVSVHGPVTKNGTHFNTVILKVKTVAYLTESKLQEDAYE